MLSTARIAYFSMEIGLESAMPTYAGGLGVLAGDTVRSAADAGLPMVAVSLLPRKGYCRQHLDETGWQTETPYEWEVAAFLHELPPRVQVHIEQRPVQVRAWCYEVKGLGGHTVPVLFLDTDLPENADADRRLSYYLYGGDQAYRLAQEVILGIGGVRTLRALNATQLQRYHMNEGHAALLAGELLRELIEQRGDRMATRDHVDAIRPLCVFTTHTPVAAGHDQFPLELVHRVISMPGIFRELEQEFCPEGVLNMTYLALVCSHYVNGVAKKHREISQQLFGGSYTVDSITNGVHLSTWASPAMQRLFDERIPGWREDNASVRYAMSFSMDEIEAAHREAKSALIRYINENTRERMDEETITLGFARRATQYKRTNLIFTDVGRLRAVAEASGPIQLVFSGKAHPHDQGGKELIQRVFRAREELRGSKVRIVYLPDYDMRLGGLMTAGCDVWINTPQPPLEASGTSGMKAAINGVPSLSVLDGWWLEGCLEGLTGWRIDDSLHDPPGTHARSLYNKLERVVLPLYYRDYRNFIRVMRAAIAINGSFFNTERMIDQYVTKAYFK